jgi:hypothetical protein
MASDVILVNDTAAAISVDDSGAGVFSVPAFSIVEATGAADFEELIDAGLTVVLNTSGAANYAKRRSIANALRHARRLAVATPTYATLDNDASQGANAAVTFTADGALIADDGWKGNSVSVVMTVPTDDNEAHDLAISVALTPGGGQVHDAYLITIQLGVDTDGSTIVTTSDDLKTAIAASDAAAALVSVADTAGNDGSGLCSVMAEAALSGGSGKLYVRNAG